LNKSQWSRASSNEDGPREEQQQQFLPVKQLTDGNQYLVNTLLEGRGWQYNSISLDSKSGSFSIKSTQHDEKHPFSKSYTVGVEDKAGAKKLNY